MLEHHPEEIKAILKIINTKTATFKNIENIDVILSKRYQQKLEDVQKWLSITAWESVNSISEELIAEIQNKMIAFNVIDSKADAGKFIKNMYI